VRRKEGRGIALGPHEAPPFGTKIGYIGNKVLGGDLVPPDKGWPTIQ